MLLFLVFLLHLAIFGRTFAANRRCPEVHFWNGTACRPCSGCPTGEGVMVNCSIYKDTQCQPCWHGFDYSNTTGMEACQGCDENSNCLPGNFKVIKNCTVSSATVCDGCEAGFYFNKDQGEQGGCVKCSPLCRVDEVETKGCKTERDRVCSKRASTTENILNPTFFWTETDYNGRDDTTSTPSSDHTDEDLTITKPWAGKYRDMPLHNKPWFWIVVSLCSICIILPTVVFSAAAKRRQRHSDGTQQLIPPHGLDQPIRTLLVEQRSFIAMRLDCKDSQSYGYWQRVAEKLNLANESRAFNSLPNPTEAFLTLYSEKQGSTVRTLVDACEEAGLTHFASEMREKFGAQDHEEIEAGEHESAV